MITAPNNLTEEMIRDIKVVVRDLNAFLRLNEVNPDSDKLMDVINAVKQLKVMLTSKKYAGLIFDTNGYVIKAYPIGDFMETYRLPKDINGGYYQLVNDKLVLDEERKRQLEEV